MLIFMKGISVQLDDETMAQLDQVAPPCNGARAEFIRRAIKAAILRSEFDRIRESYLREPQSFEDGDDWGDPLEWNPKPAAE